jgi:Na+-driven multidrug efflux pump
MAVILILIITTFLVILINIFKETIASYYTSDTTVISKATKALVYFSIALFPDSMIYA